MAVELSITIGSLTDKLITEDVKGEWQTILETAAIVLAVTPNNPNPTPKQKLRAVLLEIANHISGVAEKVGVESALMTYNKQAAASNIARQAARDLWLQ